MSLPMCCVARSEATCSTRRSGAQPGRRFADSGLVWAQVLGATRPRCCSAATLTPARPRRHGSGRQRPALCLPRRARPARPAAPEPAPRRGRPQAQGRRRAARAGRRKPQGAARRRAAGERAGQPAARPAAAGRAVPGAAPPRRPLIASRGVARAVPKFHLQRASAAGLRSSALARAAVNSTRAAHAPRARALQRPSRRRARAQALACALPWRRAPPLPARAPPQAGRDNDATPFLGAGDRAAARDPPCFASRAPLCPPSATAAPPLPPARPGTFVGGPAVLPRRTTSAPAGLLAALEEAGSAAGARPPAGGGRAAPTGRRAAPAWRARPPPCPAPARRRPGGCPARATPQARRRAHARHWSWAGRGARQSAWAHGCRTGRHCPPGTRPARSGRRQWAGVCRRRGSAGRATHLETRPCAAGYHLRAAGDNLALCAEAPAEAARPRPGGPAHVLTRLGAARPGWSAGHRRAGRSARSRRRPARRARTARRPAAAPRPARPPAAWPARRSARAPAAATHGGRARLPASVHFTSASHACEGVPTLAACRMLARRRPWPIANRAPSGRPADAPQGAQVSFSLPLCAEAPPQGLAAKRPATPQRERPSPAPQAWAPPSPCLTACAPGPGPPSGSPRRLAPLQPWAGANAERPCAAAMPGGGRLSPGVAPAVAAARAGTMRRPRRCCAIWCAG